MKDLSRKGSLFCGWLGHKMYFDSCDVGGPSTCKRCGHKEPGIDWPTSIPMPKVKPAPKRSRIDHSFEHLLYKAEKKVSDAHKESLRDLLLQRDSLLALERPVPVSLINEISSLYSSIYGQENDRKIRTQLVRG